METNGQQPGLQESGAEKAGPADPSSRSPPLPPTAALDDRLLAAAEIERALGQTIQAALDLGAWDENAGVEKLFSRVHSYIVTRAREEGRLNEGIRRHVLAALPTFEDAPALAGVYDVSDTHLRAALRNHLLGGAVTAVHGACTGHEGLVATIVSIGVSLVRYDGQLNSWQTTFLRHDYGLTGGDTVEELRQVLNRRGRRSPGGPGAGLGRDHITYLLRRGFMAAAERKALVEKTTSRWRLGRGVPAPLELLTGSGSMALIDEILPILDRLLLQNQHWVFIPSMQGNWALTTLANALEKGQIAIFQKGKPSLDAIIEAGHFDTGYRRRVLEFAERLGEAMVIGGFRATRHAPAQLFAAHARHALTAGIIAMADATLQPHRGFPLLLELAGVSAKVGLGVEAFQGVVEAAYAKAGAGELVAPGRILSQDS